MKNETCPLAENKVFRLGYGISLSGTALLLFWIGIFKFTPTEADAIRPLLENHPLTCWAYDVFSARLISNAVGSAEIVLALLLLASVRVGALRRYVGIGITCVFLFTLSFLFFTPGIWKITDGVPVTEYFILKDVAYLGFGLMLWGLSPKRQKREQD